VEDPTPRCWRCCALLVGRYLPTCNPGCADAAEVIAHADLLLLSPALRKKWRPDVVLHIGGGFVSRRGADFLCESAPQHYVLVHPGPARLGYRASGSIRVMAISKNFCMALTKRLSRRASHARLALWRRADAVAAGVLDQHMAAQIN